MSPTKKMAHHARGQSNELPRLIHARCCRWRGRRKWSGPHFVNWRAELRGPNVTRQQLPNRRGHERLDFEHSGIRYTAGVGRFEDGGLAEIFLNTAKHGTAIDVNARDAAVAASLLLQHGCSVDTLRQALTRNSDGSASGPLARALDLLAGGR